MGFSYSNQGIPSMHSLCRLGNTLATILPLKSPHFITNWTYPAVATSVPSANVTSWNSSSSWTGSPNAVAIASETKLPVAPESTSIFTGRFCTVLDNSNTRPRSRTADTISSSTGPPWWGLSLCDSPAATPGPVLPLWTTSDRDGRPSPISGSALSTKSRPWACRVSHQPLHWLGSTCCSGWNTVWETAEPFLCWIIESFIL